MNNVELNWTLPQVDPARQKPIKHVLIEMQADGTTSWTPAGLPVVPPETTLTMADIASGRWHFRATVFDSLDQPSPNPKTVTVDVPFDAPGDVVTLTATLV